MSIYLYKKRGTPCFLFRDPKTKRCTKRCDSVINKRTNRCVLRKGSVGKSLRGKLTKCRSFRNQQTGRCITKRKRMSRQQKKSKRGSSRSHKRGSRKRKSNHTRGSRRKRRSGRSSGRKIKPLMCIPRKFEGIVEECECIKRWKKQTHLGSGAYGTAYHACTIANSKDCKYVVKVQPNNATAKRELDAYIRLNSKTNVVPKLHAAWLCKNKMYLVIDQMFKCKLNQQKIKVALDRLLQLGWLHVDVHPGNVMCTKSGDICLIDLGWAVHESDEPYSNHPTGRRSFDALLQVQEINLSNI